MSSLENTPAPAYTFFISNQFTTNQLSDDELLSNFH